MKVAHDYEPGSKTSLLPMSGFLHQSLKMRGIPYKGLTVFRGLIKTIMQTVWIPDTMEKESRRGIKA